MSENKRQELLRLVAESNDPDVYLRAGGELFEMDGKAVADFITSAYDSEVMARRTREIVEWLNKEADNHHAAGATNPSYWFGTIADMLKDKYPDAFREAGT